MKNVLIIFGLLVSLSGFGAVSVGTPTTMNVLDTASTNLGLGYDYAASPRLTELKGVSNFFVWNATSGVVGVNVKQNTCNSSGADQYMVPATSGVFIERVAIAKSICLRSLTGSSLSSGKIYVGAW